jgi:hypothetical protein
MSQLTRQGWKALEDWRAFDGSCNEHKAVEGFGLTITRTQGDASLAVYLPFRANYMYSHVAHERRPNVLVATYEGHVEAKVLWGDKEGTAWFDSFPKFLEE